MPKIENRAAKLAALQAVFHQSIPAKLQDIRTIWEAVIDSDNPAVRNELYRKVHSLAGAGGTFGLHLLSKVAYELEILIKPLMDDLRQPSEDERLTIDMLLGRLDTLSSDFMPIAVEYATTNMEQEKSTLSDNNLVYIVDDDEILLDTLAMQIQQAGYDVHTFTDTEQFVATCQQVMPAAVIIDMVFTESSTAGAEAIDALKNNAMMPPLVIFISVRGDIESRLFAVRVGAHRYLTKPIDIDKLIDTLNGMTTRAIRSSFRVLVIDDERTLAAYYAEILRDSGIQVEVLNDSIKGLEVIESFKPELILMDVFMPRCSGLELAAVIRQDDQYANIPIVFISTETNLDKQMAALDLGGDDFLTKPIDPRHLIQAVIARLKRSRWVNRLKLELQAEIDQNRYQVAALEQHAMLSETDTNGIITTVNEKFCEISGYTRDELISKPHNLVKSTYHPDEFYQSIWTAISQGQIWHGQLHNQRKDGSEYIVEATIVPLRNDKAEVYKYLSIQTPIITA